MRGALTLVFQFVRFSVLGRHLLTTVMARILSATVSNVRLQTPKSDNYMMAIC